MAQRCVECNVPVPYGPWTRCTGCEGQGEKAEHAERRVAEARLLEDQHAVERRLGLRAGAGAPKARGTGRE